MSDEPLTLHCLANAIEALLAAQQKTENGFVSDYCENALHQCRLALGCFSEQYADSEKVST